MEEDDYKGAGGKEGAEELECGAVSPPKRIRAEDGDSKRIRIGHGTVEEVVERLYEALCFHDPTRMEKCDKEVVGSQS